MSDLTQLKYLLAEVEDGNTLKYVKQLQPLCEPVFDTYSENLPEPKYLESLSLVDETIRPTYSGCATLMGFDWSIVDKSIVAGNPTLYQLLVDDYSLVPLYSGTTSLSFRKRDDDNSGAPNEKTVQNVDVSIDPTSITNPEIIGYVFGLSLAEEIVNDPELDIYADRVGTVGRNLIRYDRPGNLHYEILQMRKFTYVDQYSDANIEVFDFQFVALSSFFIVAEQAMDSQIETYDIVIEKSFANPIETGQPNSFSSIVTVNILNPLFDESNLTNITYNWTFGDGSPVSSDVVATHIWTEEGEYLVTCDRSFDFYGRTYTASAQTDVIVVGDSAQGIPPVAHITASPIEGLAPLGVSFSAAASENTPHTWEWDFGDNSENVITESAAHTFIEPGTYLVSLRVVNQYGQNLTTKSITVLAEGESPSQLTAAFEATSVFGQAPKLVQFIDNSLGGVTGWLWDFGDGGSSVMQNPSHIYSVPGQYTVKLTVNNFENEVDIESKIGYISVSDPGGGEIPPPIYNDEDDAHNAIMQNIRFLKKMLTMVNDNLWGAVNNSLSMSNKQLDYLVKKINEFDDTNTVMNRIETRIPAAASEVKVSILGSSDWEVFNGQVTHSNEVGMLSVNLNEEKYTHPGKYLFSIKPKEIRIEVGSKSGDIIHIPSSFEGNVEVLNPLFLTRNSLYGWNIEFFNADGTPLGITKMIVGSRGDSSGLDLKVSPLFEGELDLNANNLVAKIWASTFESQLIQVDILEHDAKTLSYSLYGKRTMDRTNGLMKIYDHNGNVYKTFSMGTVSNGETSGDIIDYRCNTEDEICMDGNEENK